MSSENRAEGSSGNRAEGSSGNRAEGPALFVSSTFWGTLLGALAIWALGATITWGIHALAFRAIVERWTAELDERVEETLEDVIEAAAEEGAAEPEPLEQLVDLWEEDVEASFSEVLQTYVREVRWAAAGRGEAERRPLLIRLALLGEHPPKVLEGQDLEAYVELMEEELPERHWGSVKALVSARIEEWEDRESAAHPGEAAALPTAAGVRALAVEHDLRESTEVCFRLRGPGGEVLASNMEEPEAPRRLGDGATLVWSDVPADLVEELERQRRRCLLREVSVEGGILLLGNDVTEGYPPLERMTWLRNLIFLLGLPLSLLIAYLQARSPVRFLRDLRRARARIEGGSFRARLGQGHSDGAPRGDFGHARAEINGMLERTEKLMASLSQMTDNIAHDLRTPLTRLQGQLDLLKRGSASSEGSEIIAEAVQEEANQLLSTFNALLRIAQVESGSRRQGFRAFDLAEVVRDVGELYAPAFADGDLRLDCVVPDGPVPFHGDSDLWMQALSNLLDNALKYTPRGGRAILTLEAVVGLSGSPLPGPCIVLRDTGPGIPEGERENVFKRFYRLARHRGARGNGLGLSLVAAVCDLHDARVELENEGGLVVRVQLPARGG